ncbi:MAG: FAD-binding oxidoreductase [Anaerolineae bacterium]|nr:FAD-binding oxidoreductase [Anaerolineae bacterium]NUQ04584.1 FAD-binding oxidoreductase [Anaerolineae bacterium]
MSSPSGDKYLLHPTQDAMPKTADVVVIGGGPTGAAAVWAMERARPGLRTLLIEREERLGAGSSLASLENYRTCWPNIPIMKQMQRSVAVLHNADAYLGEGAAQSIHLKEQGYLFLAMGESHAEALKKDVARLHAIGLRHIEYLDAGEVGSRYPALRDVVVAAKWDPTAGWMDSNALIHAFVRAAPNARVLLGVTSTQIRTQGGRVVGVRTPLGDIDAPVVILAAGAWAPLIARESGIALPIILRPRQSFTTGYRHTSFGSDWPMLIGEPPAPHVRPEAGEGAIFGWEYHWHSKWAPELEPNPEHDAVREPSDALNRLKDPRFPSLTLALMARQFRHGEGEGFNDPRYLRGLYHNIGYYVYRDETAAYTVQPDGTRLPYESERAIICPHPDVPGLILSVAHVGHGVMTSPAAGELAAAYALGLPLPDPDYAAFSLDVPYVDYDAPVL